MFNRLDISIDFVEFEYMDGGHLCVTTVGRPDGVSYSQWSGLWDGFKELVDRRSLVDESEYEQIVNENSTLENRVSDLENEVSDLESEISDLELDKKTLEAELAEVNFRLESLCK